MSLCRGRLWASRPLLVPPQGGVRAGGTPALPLLLLNYAHEMRDFGDHAPRRRCVLQLFDAADAIESETDKGLALVVAATNRAADLLDLYGLLGGRHDELRKLGYSVAAVSASASRRRACSDDTLMFRRAATERGESWCFKASKVARTML